MQSDSPAGNRQRLSESGILHTRLPPSLFTDRAPFLYPFQTTIVPEEATLSLEYISSQTYAVIAMLLQRTVLSCSFYQLLLTLGLSLQWIAHCDDYCRRQTHSYAVHSASVKVLSTCSPTPSAHYSQCAPSLFDLSAQHVLPVPVYHMVPGVEKLGKGYFTMR